MDELLSRALDARGGLGNCAGLSGLTAETGKLLAHGTTTCLLVARLEGQ